MTANTISRQFMEHRWGTRIQLDARAELWTAEGVSGFGVVRNASLSGAWIETKLKIGSLARVALQPMDRPGEWLDGCVVRVEPHGIAVEWLDPGLHAVSALLSLRHDVPQSAGDATLPPTAVDQHLMRSALMAPSGETSSL